jgi:hypothetical protein
MSRHPRKSGDPGVAEKPAERPHETRFRRNDDPSLFRRKRTRGDSSIRFAGTSVGVLGFDAEGVLSGRNLGALHVNAVGRNERTQAVRQIDVGHLQIGYADARRVDGGPAMGVEAHAEFERRMGSERSLGRLVADGGTAGNAARHRGLRIVRARSLVVGHQRSSQRRIAPSANTDGRCEQSEPPKSFHRHGKTSVKWPFSAILIPS